MRRVAARCGCACRLAGCSPSLPSKLPFLQRRQRLSSATAVPPNAAVTATGGVLRPAVAKEQEGIFSRHGGKMVLGFLGSVGLYFYRNSVGSDNASAVKDLVEERCPLEPREVEELRCANDLPPHVFEQVVAAVREAFPAGAATYPDFVRVVSSVLQRPLELGYLLDRAVLGDGAVQPPPPPLPPRDDSDTTRVTISPKLLDRDVPRQFCTDYLLAAFSMAINSTADERVVSLHDLMAAWQEEERQRQQLLGRGVSGGDGYGESSSSGHGSETSEEALQELQQQPRRRTKLGPEAAARLLELLQASHQLPAAKYATRAEVSYPTQQYRLATGKDLLEKSLGDSHEEAERRAKGWLERKMSPKFDAAAAAAEGLDCEEMAAVLRGHVVCAWGECYPVPRADGYH